MSDSIQYIKGVGPKRAELLEKLGIASVEDLLRYYPRDWQDRRTNSLLSIFRQESCAVCRGAVLWCRRIFTKGPVGLFKAGISCGGAEIEAVWFKRTAGLQYDPLSALEREMARGRELWIIGRPNNAAGTSVAVEEYYFAGDEGAAPHVERLVPLYPLTAGLSNKFMREAVWRALEKCCGGIEDIVPPELAEKRKLLSATQALRGLHFPGTMGELDAARKRIVYEEFLLLSAAWEIKKRQNRAAGKKHTYQIKRSLLTPFRQQLGFEFTPAQKRVINEIFADLRSPRPMTRLLQGDVGSGKTVVALSALMLAVENGYQGAFMAPTEILAGQHFLTFRRFLQNLPVKFELLTSSTRPAARKAALERISKGETNLVIGTHALLEEDVRFAALRLAVIDEQHRFGVRQRALLRQKASGADLLVMTATPIPRTLALALYGDLDISTIDELPPGRQPVETISAAESEAFEIARREVAAGRQAYIVHPFIEESGDEDVKSVSAQYERLSKEIFPGIACAMLHGRMKPKDKSSVMEKFAAGEIKILAATPVIEVGIDVKNAAVMIIQNAERFGLASLHQLRGRVGRGVDKSRCVLVSESGGEQARARIGALCSTNDGFKIGEKDMEMRGPGDFMGIRQHGELDLRAGDLVEDREVLAWAAEDKGELFRRDPELQSPQHRPFRRRLLELYSRKWHLIDIA
ncbi:MAG: ATP-dependent DNA helicase RecG [Elusimicrobiales bacterium]